MMEGQHRFGMRERGNVFFLLFAAVGMAGVVGLSMQNFVMNPLKTASTVTRKNSAETQMQLGIRVAATNAVTQQASSGDCDGDGMVEPLPYVDPGANPAPVGGGLLPNNIGSVRMDPWNTQYGYCVWDHGSAIDDAGCGGAPQLRLPGTNAAEWETMAVISAGPDKVFQTTCNAWADVDVNNQPDTPLVNKPATSDDVYYAWTYQEASSGSGGLWTLETADPNTAEINKNISVKDGSNVEQLAFDASTKALTIGTGGSGEIPTVKTDFLQALSNPVIQMPTGLSFGSEDGSGRNFSIRNLEGDGVDIGYQGSSGALLGMYEPWGIFELKAPHDPAFEYNFLQLGEIWTGASALDIVHNRKVAGLSSGVSMTSLRTGGVGPTEMLFRSSHATTTVSSPSYITSYISMKDGGGVANPSLLSGAMSFHTRPTGTAAGATTLPERMVIDSSGNVGIGNPTPSARLHVTGANVFLATGGSDTLGINATSPVVKMDVNGAIKLGTTVTACSGTIEGSVRYNAGTRCLELCDGTSWSCIQSSQCSTNTPAAITFTDVTGATPSTSYRSNIVQITGIGTCTVGIDEMNATAEFRICTNGTSEPNCDASVVQGWTMGTGTGAAGVVTNNQYVQLRMTSRPNGNLTRTAQLQVGGRTANWSVTPAGLCTDPSPPSGTMCADGTMFVGMSPDNGEKMFTTPCRLGRTFNPNAYTCTGNRIRLVWSTNNTISTGVTNANTGEANTATLAALSNADAPYNAAAYCQNLTLGGSTDWYLPALNEAILFRTNCGVFASAPDHGSCLNPNQFWTSTEFGAAEAYLKNLDNNFNFYFNKTDRWDIFCVRKGEPPADPCAGSPAIGTQCTDGSFYAGLSPDGNVKMYVTDQSYQAYMSPWGPLGVNNGISYCTSGAEVSCRTGESNTATLALNPANNIPLYCDNLNAHGKTDWYLPSRNELLVLYASSQTGLSGMEQNWHYSSSESGTDHAWIVTMFDGSLFSSGYKLNNDYVRCVRKD